MKKSSFIIVFTLLSLTMYTNCYAGCSDWGCIGKTKSFYLNSLGNIYVQMDVSPAEQALANCTLVADTYFTLDHSHLNKKEIYATLLTARTAGLDVTVRINEGSSNCSINYVTLATQ